MAYTSAVREVVMIVLTLKNAPVYAALIEARDHARKYTFVPTGRIVIRKARRTKKRR